jgi:hypothetical protein
MKLKLKPLKLETSYLLELRNVKTGKVRTEETHNVILDQFFENLSYTNRFCSYCHLGSGSGVPSSSDKLLFNKLFDVSRDRSKCKIEFINETTIVITAVYIFPASSSYVGTITELGVGGSYYDASQNSSYLATHALVLDSEGNPISIEKTDLDELTVTVKFTITRQSWTTGQTFMMKHGWLGNEYNAIYGAPFASSSTYTSIAVIREGWFADAISRSFENPQTVQRLSYDRNSRTWSMYAEWSTQSTFTGFVNSIAFGNGYIDRYCGSGGYIILFPNQSIFPQRTLEGLALGTGDGITTDFSPSIPAWVADTEVVYKNGVALTRGVDYLVDNSPNLAKNKYMTIGNFVCKIDALWKNSFNYVIPGGCYYNQDDSGLNPYLDKDHPMVLHYSRQHAFNSKMNAYVLGQWQTVNGSLPAGSKVIFEYSTDNGNVYTEFANYTFEYQSSSFNDNTKRFLSSTIEGITQIRIRIELPEGSDWSGGLYCYSETSYFGYEGEYAIRFTTPPASGDVLTIDLDIDRPYKSPDYVLKLTPEITF